MNERKLLELKDTIHEIKNPMNNFNSIFYIAEERISEMEVNQKKISRMKNRRPNR